MYTVETRTAAIQFFYENAGYSYNPLTQTEEEGRIECARNLADSEAHAQDMEYTFTWEEDDEITSADWDDESEEYPTWVCTMYAKNGYILSTMGGIDLGVEGYQKTNPYTRVVEAELVSMV